MPLWALRLLPYAAAALALGGALWWAYDKGRDTEREKWQQKEAVATLKARERENALQAQVDAAGAALSVSQTEIERLTKDRLTNTRTFYVQSPAADIACLLPDRLRHVQESDAREQDADTASASPR